MSNSFSQVPPIHLGRLSWRAIPRSSFHPGLPIRQTQGFPLSHSRLARPLAHLVLPHHVRFTHSACQSLSLPLPFSRQFLPFLSFIGSFRSHTHTHSVLFPSTTISSFLPSPPPFRQLSILRPSFFSSLYLLPSLYNLTSIFPRQEISLFFRVDLFVTPRSRFCRVTHKFILLWL